MEISSKIIDNSVRCGIIIVKNDTLAVVNLKRS